MKVLHQRVIYIARKYQHVQHELEEIKEMLAQGMTQTEVAEALGLERAANP